MMITPQEAVERLVGICPGFAESWRAHIESWEGKPAGEYNDVAVLAEWIVARVAGGDLDCLPSLFSEVERLLNGADTDLRNVLVIGLLEDVHDLATDQRIDASVVVSLLGPESRKEWAEVVRWRKR